MKFGSLLKKELRSLINKQTILTMIVMFGLYAFMGQVMGHAIDEGMDTSSVNICSHDNSEFTQYILSELKDYGSVPQMYELQSDDYAAELDRLGIDDLIIIDEGYSDSILNQKKPGNIRYVCRMKFGITSNMGSISASDALSALETASSDALLLKSYGLTDEDIDLIKKTDLVTEYTTMSGKCAKVPASALMSLIMSQSLIAPFAIFFLLLMASQTIMTAIANEKIDKTLETLLSCPVSRITVLSAKMTAALLAALLNSLVMVAGFVLYLVGMMGNAGTQMINTVSTTVPNAADITGQAADVASAINELGLNIGTGGCVIIGIQLFLTVAIGLCIALILGATAEDAQSQQTLLMPIMLAAMIPFFITMFTDFGEMSTGLKFLLCLIPFTHSYLAIRNIMTGDTAMLIIGLVYQAAFLAGTMFFAVKLFTSDRIFTMSGKLFNKLKKNKPADK